ncbi:MAG: GAF domain-containing protein, partial [Actinobacteria bacterium]
MRRTSQLSRPYSDCEAAGRPRLRRPGDRLRLFRFELRHRPPGRSDRPARDRPFHGGADPRLRGQAVQSADRRLAWQEAQLRAQPLLPLRPRLRHDLFDQQLDREAFGLLDAVSALRDRAWITRGNERQTGRRPRAEEAPPWVRLSELRLPAYRQGCRLRPRGVEGEDRLDRLPRATHRLLRRALLNEGPDRPRRRIVVTVTEQLNPALKAVSDAVLAIGAELSVEEVLQNLVHSARTLVDARYAALGIPDDDGGFSAFLTSGMSDKLIASLGPLPRTHGMLGAILEAPTPFRTSDIHEDPRFNGWWPRGHPDMRSFLGVPIVSQEGVIGAFYLTEKEGAQEFGRADQEVIELLASHAAIAITHARLSEQSRELSVISERNRLALDLHDVVS